MSPGGREARRAARALASSLEAAGADRIEAVGTFVSRQRQPARRGPVTSIFELELQNPLHFIAAPVFVGLHSPELHEFGLATLRVTLTRDGAVVLDELFADAAAAAARAFLDGAFIDLGPILETTPVIPNPFPPGIEVEVAPTSEVVLLRIEIETRERRAALQFGFLVATGPPEP